MRREPTFAERISSNESRFFKRVSFRQMSLVSSNESRCVKRVSFRETSLALTRFDSLEQTSLVENRLSSDSLIVTIKNRVVSQKPWVIQFEYHFKPTSVQRARNAVNSIRARFNYIVLD